MRTNTNPGVVKYQARCSCGKRGKKHATETIARLSMVVHSAHAELISNGDSTDHHVGVMAVFA